jgi:WhiB family redox-sensing transcriptional regulator
VTTKHKRHFWQEDALCVGVETEVFFPNDKGMVKERWQSAKAVCAFCPVRKPCLESAMVRDEHDDQWGVFGGLSPLERRALRKKRKEKK